MDKKTDDSCLRTEPWDHSGYDKINDWRKRSKALLDEILDVLEKEENLGFYDSLMDMGTDASLIRMAYDKYLTNSNRKHGIHNDKHTHTPEEIQRQNKGGYDNFDRIKRILTK